MSDQYVYNEKMREEDFPSPTQHSPDGERVERLAEWLYNRVRDEREDGDARLRRVKHDPGDYRREPWSDLPETAKNGWRKEARAALAAAEQEEERLGPVDQALADRLGARGGSGPAT